MREAAATRDVAGGPAPGHSRAPVSVVATCLHWLCIATAVTVLGGISILSLLGYRIMVVTGPSMEPRFGPGDAVVVRPSGADGVVVGDVITYRTPGAQGMTTHRVLDVRTMSGRTWFQTKGDANSAADPNLTQAEDVYGRQLMAFRGLGRPLLFAVSPWGKLAMLGFPVSYLIAQEVAVLLAVRRRREQASEQEPEEVQDVVELADMASGLEGRIGRDSEEVAELRLQLERTEAELKMQAFRLAALEAALVSPSGGGSEPHEAHAEAESLLVLS